MIASLELSVVNVIIDKSKIHNSDYHVLEKDSKESHFIQICDFISYFVHLYYKIYYEHKELPNRVGNLIDRDFVGRVMATKASSEKYGLVIYPKK